ncbi:MAG: deoxynucleoside kinase [Bacteroidales bacterium]|nr:deoxynucleoside kinase [Bacteroidales bacterium]
MKYNYIVIEGNIGAGKTSLVKMISKQYNARMILEQFTDNPFLPKFYNDQERYSFPLELSFLADRYRQLKTKLGDQDLFTSFTISDYYFMKSLIFAKSTLADDEFRLYRQIFNIIYQSLPKPGLYVYLHLDVEELLYNISCRGRDYEKSITAEYLRKIQNGYFEFFKQETNMKILVIDTCNVDFVNNNDEYENLISAIFDKKYQKGINRVVL